MSKTKYSSEKPQKRQQRKNKVRGVGGGLTPWQSRYSFHPWKTWGREGFPEALQPMEEFTPEKREGMRRREWQRETAKY